MNSIERLFEQWLECVSRLADVIGVVKSTSDVQTIVGKATQKEFIKRQLLLVDEKASIAVSIWGQQVGVERREAFVSMTNIFQAEEFDGSANPVVAFKGIKIGDYNGQSQ